MACSSPDKMKIVELATRCQQNFYELLPDWFQYDSDDYPYIKQDIGFALFGLAQIEKQKCTINKNSPLNINEDTDIFSTITYDQKSRTVINTIYEKIIKYASKSQNSFIYVGVIYNVIFNHITIKKSKENNNSCNEEFEICPMPIFKIKKMDTIWYIDNNGRMYKNWEDYLKSNKLPKCIMILPKDGVYQCNPNYNITEQLSTVWVEVKDSPACAIKSKILNVCDNISNVLTVSAVIGLGVTSILTPVGPMFAAAGLVSGAVGGTWSITRKSYQLIDRSMHKESINPLNRNILSKYKDQTEVEYLDIVMFISHALFFSNIVLNTKLAGELLGLSKGTILMRFKNSLRFNRFYEEFKRLKGTNIENKRDGIIRRIKKIVNKDDFLNTLNKNFYLKFENGKIMINNITLLDPLLFACKILKTVGIISNKTNKVESNSLSVGDNSSDMMNNLKDLLSKLLTSFFIDKQSVSNQKLPDVNYFHSILAEIRFMTDAKDILIKIFKISEIVIQNCNERNKFLVDVIYFVWEYSKANLKEYDVNVCSPLKTNSKINILTKIITVMYEVIDKISNDLFEAFYTYMLNTESLNHAY